MLNFSFKMWWTLDGGGGEEIGKEKEMHFNFRPHEIILIKAFLFSKKIAIMQPGFGSTVMSNFDG